MSPKCPYCRRYMDLVPLHGDFAWKCPHCVMGTTTSNATDFYPRTRLIYMDIPTKGPSDE